MLFRSGRIVGTKTWEDVTVPANLKAKGQEYLSNARNLSATIELTAIDLHLVDVDIDRIRLGDMIRVVSPPHKLDKYMMVSKREYNLVNPEEDKIVLGDTIAALTEKQAALQKSIEKQKDVTASVEEVRGSVYTLTGEVRTAKMGVSALEGKVQVLETGSSDVQTTIQGLERSSIQANETMQGVLARLEALEKPDVELEEKLQGILDRLNALEGGA